MTFEQQLQTLLETHYQDPNFDYAALRKQLGLSRSQIYRKCQETGLPPPSQYIRGFRLQKAAILLLETEALVKTIAYDVGYLKTSHFSDNFQEKYGQRPSDYRLSNR